MKAVVEAPIEMVEAVAALRLPPRGDRRLQILMDRNTNGTLTPEQKEQLEALLELSETIGLVRAQALRVLGRKPHHEPQIDVTREKLRLLEQTYADAQHDSKSSAHTRELTLRSLRGLINQLKEEIARHEARAKTPAQAP